MTQNRKAEGFSRPHASVSVAIRKLWRGVVQDVPFMILSVMVRQRIFSLKSGALVIKKICKINILTNINNYDILKRERKVANDREVIMQIQKDHIRTRILESALEEFSSKGFRNATMSSVAEHCKISKSNLYRYFPSKEDICLELLAVPSMKIAEVLDDLTSSELLIYSNDEIAERMTDLLFPVMREYRKELMIIISSDAPEEAAALKKTVEGELMKKFIAFDPARTPQGFAETLVKMLMAGIENILINHTSDENMREQVNSLLRYHIRGVLAFSTLRNE